MFGATASSAVRRPRQGAARRALVGRSEFLIHMDGLMSEHAEDQGAHVLVMATTNTCALPAAASRSGSDAEQFQQA